MHVIVSFPTLSCHFYSWYMPHYQCIINRCWEYRIYNILNIFQCSLEYYMVGNDIVVIRQMSLLVVVHENYGVSDSSRQGKTLKLWCFWLHLCTLIIFARVQQSDPWCYLKYVNYWAILPIYSFSCIAIYFHNIH